MQQAVKVTLYVFLCIFGLTAALTIAGLGYLWFIVPDRGQLPYLDWLLFALIAEVIGVVLVIARRGLSYMPDVRTDKDADATSKFMVEFLSNGSSATIVSNRLGWLSDDSAVLEKIEARVRKDLRLEIITAVPVTPHVRDSLEALGVKFYLTQDVPEARFTLINADRSGSERLAIARGVHPHHEITIFDPTSGPQIIGMAKDIVRKSKVVSSAS